MGKFSRSWSLAKSSFTIVLTDPHLLALPAVSAVSMTVSTVAFLFGVWQIEPFIKSTSSFGQTNYEVAVTPVTGALLFLGATLLTFVSMFTNAALISATDQRLNGQRPTIGSALAGAWQSAGRIAEWAIFSTVVSTALRQASQRFGIVGRLVISVVGIAWAMVTYFVLPIIVLEGIGPKEAFGRSKELIRRSWGERVLGEGIVSVLMLPVVLGLVVVTGASALVIGVYALIPLALGLLAVIAVANMVSAVFTTVLYRYSTTGILASGFNSDAVAQMFEQKKRSRGRR